jgi:hypothetical protein
LLDVASLEELVHVHLARLWLRIVGLHGDRMLTIG